MLRPIVKVFALILLVNQVPNIFGKLTTLRGPTSNDQKNVICLSEDDGGALVWNADLTYTYYSNTYIINQYKKNFASSCGWYSSQIDCKLNDLYGCLEWWNRSNWTLTNSLITPMGLVFDQRWETFEEYTYKATRVYNVKLYNPRTIVLPFSVRAIKDVHILICDEDYTNNLCYWVIIGGWENVASVIRKCPKGVPPIGEYPDENSECIKTRTYFNHTALDPYEWRSFILTWNSDTRNVSLYDSNQLIMTYRDTEKYNDTKLNYKVFMRSSSTILIRLHDYNYLYTNTSNAVLTSNAFPMNINATCLQMLIGLCAECDADVSLYTSDDEILQTITIKGSSVAAVHGLPVWRSVKIAVNTTMYSYSGLKIVVTPKLIFSNPNPVWAIANVRQCPLNGCLRESAMYIYRDYPRGWRNKLKEYSFWPNVTCQKLFYEEQSVISVFDKANLNVELDDKNCHFGYIGPTCKFNCNATFETTFNCKAVVICNDNGCTCTPGYKGPKCGMLCDNQVYGHACKKKCGWCLNGQCDRASGVCHNGCNNIKGYYFYAPPLCKIGINKPSEIKLNFMNQTAIVAAVPMKWEATYEEVELLYTFRIEARDENVTDLADKWEKIPQDSKELIGIFENLKPGRTYGILCVLSINGFLVYGNWETVITHCDPFKNFHVTPNETSLEIVAEESENQLHPCPIKTYDVLFKNNDNPNEQRIHGSIPCFPYTLSNLTPYTSYNVTILNRKKNLFSEEVRTLEGVPSKVLSLRALVLSSTNVTLFWESPRQSKGVIKEYIVHSKIIKYLGCTDINIPTSDYILVGKTQETDITLVELHAYARYSVQVTAWNSRYSSTPETQTFSLSASLVPAVTFSLPKWENWILSWSPPKDCTAILGPLLVANIEIRGISDAVQNFSVIKNTKYDKIDLRNLLYGTEQYVAKIFALRNFGTPKNISVYEEYKFETLPKEPPNITNLEVVENDGTIQLRWQSPFPPLNGVLRGYGIVRCYFANRANSRDCDEIEVHLNETCNLWDNYMCKTFDYKNNIRKIQVVAYNTDVNDSGPAVNVTNAMLINTTPDIPRNFTFSIGENSVVDLEWFHPCKTGRRLSYFNITVDKITSILRNHAERFVEYKPWPVANYTPSYYTQLYLLPSTQYKISIKSVTKATTESNTSTLNFWTPSTVDFKGDLTFDVYESDSTIAVNTPHIENDTSNSILYIVVKGPHRDCNYVQPREELWKLADVQKNDVFWQAAAVSTHAASKGKVFVLGGADIYGNATNCPLVSGELYDITVIISEPNSPYNPVMVTRKISGRIGMKPNHPETYLIPILIILVAAAAAFFFFRRRKRQKSHKQLMLQDEMILSQNIETYEHDTKSVISDSKQTPSTPSDRQSLSRATTPEVTTITVENNDEEEEIASLVKVKDFEDYVRQAIDRGLLDKQYENAKKKGKFRLRYFLINDHNTINPSCAFLAKIFPRGQTQPWDYGKLPQNKTKNRYGNLIAYDETRVILKKLPDDAYSDYINANYITGYKKKKRYIATQGPKPNTVVDFWRMIWQEKVGIICMLANVVENGKTKCEQYWPDIGKKKKYGEIIVLNATHNVFADYCFRTLHVTHEKETRKVEHLHYTAWPDHGVPMYTHSVVTYLKKLLAIPPGDGPVVVHCSAGVGRTGTIVLCDICLHRAAAEGVVDVFAETASIRRERANMVDNKQQYLLAHLALVECLLTIPTTLPCNDTLPTRIKELKTQLSVQQHRLQDIAWQDEALRPVTTPPSLSEYNRAKNRFPELISDKVSRIYLKRYPTSNEDSDYLSAVYVDGVKLQNQYLATQLPMPSTINDFWRMIVEFKVELIVMLQQPDPDDPTCCAIAPASGEFKPTPYLNITAKEIVELENYTLQKLLLVDNSEKPPREQSVTILCCTEWKPGRNQPPPPVMTLVTFWQATERIARGDGPTVILCHDGVTGCGLYLALSFMLERMAVERECDVCLAVRAVRRSRPDFVRSLEHLEYLYDAAMTYLEYFETYANFS